MDIKQRLKKYVADYGDVQVCASDPEGVQYSNLAADALTEIERLESEIRDSNKALTVTLRLSPDIAEVVTQIAAAARKGEDS